MNPSSPAPQLPASTSSSPNVSEAELLKMATLSALPWAKGQQLVQFPDNVRGLSILDIGGGASDITATLLELGADAYAIDPRYKKKSEIDEEIRSQLRYYEVKTRIAINQTLKKFMGSISAAPDRYKVASALNLPFPDQTFDLVFSIDVITAFFDIDRPALLQCIQECYRVTKPGGTIKLLPFKDIQPAWPAQVNNARMRNDDVALEWLKTRPDVESTEIGNTAVQFHHVLTVRKHR